MIEFGTNAATVTFGDAPIKKIELGDSLIWEYISGHVLEVVAHQDDDLYFMTPDIITDLADSKTHTVLYLTAGDAGSTDPTYWQNREVGVRAAYSLLLDDAGSWTLGTETFAGITVHTAVLGRVKHIYLRLPDGNQDGTGWASTDYLSLRHLYYGDYGWGLASSITDVEGVNTLTKRQLLDFVRAVAVAEKPAIVRTLNASMSWNSGGGADDHSDHIMAGRIAYSALENLGVPIVYYRGYDTVATEPVNVTGELYDKSLQAMQAYQPYDPAIVTITTDWVSRQYNADPPYTPVAGPGGTGLNLALNASVLPSSQNDADSQTAVKAIDGVIDGYPGDSSKEWVVWMEASDGWIELHWDTAQTVSSVKLYDRPNTGDNILSGRLEFSDGSTVAVGALNTDGSATEVAFSSRTITWVRFTILTTSSWACGLAEFEVYA